MEEQEDLVSTNTNVREVLAVLGAPIEQYCISGSVDTAEVERKYGPRFRGAKLYHFVGKDEFDDAGYYRVGEVFVLVANDVADFGANIRICVMEEIDRLEKTRDKNASILDFDRTLSGYANCCDDTLLWQHGIVFAYQKKVLDWVEIYDPFDVFSSEDSSKIEKALWEKY